MIHTAEVVEYIKAIAKETYIYKAKVDSINNDHTINAKLYKGDEESDLILSNVKSPFIIGLNDKDDDLECLIACPEGDITNSYVVCFFSKTHRLHITLDKTKIELKENKLDLNINNKTKIEINDSKVSVETTEVSIKADQIKLGGDGATESYVLGDTLNTAVATLVGMIQGHTHGFTQAPSGKGETEPSAALAGATNPVDNALSKTIIGKK